MKRLLIAALLVIAVGSGGVCPSVATAGDALVQVSTIDALLAGLYDGVATVGSLKQQGTLGIGTFDSLDGEMVVVDGTVYRVSADGRVAQVSDDETSPFATVTTFEAEQKIPLATGMDFKKLPALIADAGLSPNLFYAFRLEGRFKAVTTRSVPRQVKPYAPLVEVVKSQPLFNFEDIEGVMVGFYCPAYVKGVNVPGYHLHFLTADRTAGGHVLSFSAEDVNLSVDTLHRFTLQLPSSHDFATVNLRRDRHQELKKVEK